jgi:tRNA (guanine37-N1)-methyltransferase
MFQGPLQESILRRAQDKGLVTISVHDLRSWTHDRHRVVDDVPYGGGAGMVLKPEPVFEAVEALRQGPDSTVVALTPQGLPFGQRLACELARIPHLILLCGRYEGFDDRIPQGLQALEVSIGDFVLSGGEIPALVVLDATVRLVPGVLGDDSRIGGDGFVRHGFAGAPALHAAADVPRDGGAADPAVGGPSGHRALATEAGPAAHPGAAPGSSADGESVGPGSAASDGDRDGGRRLRA